tara:strand:- start:928 stop:1260 length:333 start_codon:yes stop_codon:yes gene_type:complete
MSKILGTHKTEQKLVFILEKKNSFYKPFEKLLFKFGFEDYELPDCFPHSDHNPTFADLSKENDFRVNLNEPGLDLEVIFGKDKIFIISTGSKSKLDQFNKRTFKHFSFKS